ncbi:hypothetical protein ACWD11_15330 [Streptomyces sp. NPDC002776]
MHNEARRVPVPHRPASPAVDPYVTERPYRARHEKNHDPFQTIEDVVLLDDRTLAVLNDNNFPFSSGRTAGQADDNEFITVRLAERLHADPRALF